MSYETASWHLEAPCFPTRNSNLFTALNRGSQFSTEVSGRMVSPRVLFVKISTGILSVSATIGGMTSRRTLQLEWRAGLMFTSINHTLISSSIMKSKPSNSNTPTCRMRKRACLTYYHIFLNSP